MSCTASLACAIVFLLSCVACLADAGAVGAGDQYQNCAYRSNDECKNNTLYLRPRRVETGERINFKFHLRGREFPNCTGNREHYDIYLLLASELEKQSCSCQCYKTDLWSRHVGEPTGVTRCQPKEGDSLDEIPSPVLLNAGCHWLYVSPRGNSSEKIAQSCCFWVEGYTTITNTNSDRNNVTVPLPTSTPDVATVTDKVPVLISTMILGLVCVLVTVLISTIYWCWKKTSSLDSSVASDKAPEHELSDSLSGAILLVYADDCDDLHNVMKCLCKVLSDVLKCRVHHHHERDLLEDNASWFNITWQKCRMVLVVDSEVAQILCKNENAAYQKSDYQKHFAKLFFHKIFPDLQYQHRDKFRLVRFQDFSPTAMICSSPVYTLPSMFPELVTCLQGTTEAISSCSEQLNLLHQLVTKLASFKKNNPHYLDKILYPR